MKRRTHRRRASNLWLNPGINGGAFGQNAVLWATARGGLAALALLAALVFLIGLFFSAL